MKKILITGANSYIGTSVQNWLEKEPQKYEVVTLDMRNPKWTEYDFSKFDVVFHVAGIVHSSKKKSMEDLYFKINRDLAIEVAKKSKQSGVKHFIFMSSMLVYNSHESKISKTTRPNPNSYYGLSKLQAEDGIIGLSDGSFKVCILRPPMVYGLKSKGNFPKLATFANKTFVFPKFNNKRSAIYIDNLSSSIKFLIDHDEHGIFFPQNSTHYCTYSIVNTIASLRNKKIWFTILLNPIIYLLRPVLPIFRKIFGDFYYDMDMSGELLLNNKVDFTDSIDRSIPPIKD